MLYAEIHPEATGNAKEIVKQHQSPQELILYSGWFCPFVQRVWIALEEKGIPYQYMEENPYHKDAEFLKISPKGLVPALAYKGQPVHESLVILEFLEEQYPETKPLLPKDAYDRAQVRLAIDLTSKSFVPQFFKLLQAQDADGQAKAREALYLTCQKYGDQVTGPFWGGSEISLADVALIPWAGRLYVVVEHREFDLSKTNPKFEAWVKHVLEVPSFKKTLSEKQHYSQIYARYLNNTAQSEAAKATRSGGVIP